MDTITQGLLGAITAELGFRQKLGKGATLAAALAACTPDLDIFIARPLRWWSQNTDTDLWRTIHRGPTHALLMVPVIALIFTVGWWYLRKWSPLKRRRLAAGKPVSFDPDHPPGGFLLMLIAMTVAVATHGLLDVTTTWGTQIFWPFSTDRYAVDLMPIVDIFYTPILLLSVLACWLIRRFKDQPRRATLIAGWVGFLLSMGYMTTAGVLRSKALAKAAASAPLAAGMPAAGSLTYRAYPQVGTIFLWRVTARGEGLWMAAKMNFIAGRQDMVRWHKVTDKDDRWIRAARAAPRTRSFEWFTQGFTRAETHKNGDGSRVVTFYDMRYGVMPDDVKSHWSLEVNLDAAGNVTASRRLRHFRRGNRTEMIRRYWREIWSPSDGES